MQSAILKQWCVTPCVLLAVLAGGHHASAEQREHRARDPRYQATVVHDGAWSDWQEESASNFQCDQGKVMVGREREWEDDGADENANTRYLCATVEAQGKLATSGLANWSALLPEQDHDYSCATNQYKNKVMVGRQHTGDEHSDQTGEGTKYRCATLIDQFGDELYIDQGPTQMIESEGYHGAFKCGKDLVMTARAHSGDENGKTTYNCAKVW
jgi:hypothetical protein